MVSGADSGDRGQAYTLESIASAVIVLTAVLFALQSIIITPTTSSAVDPEVRSELQQQADDVLVITANNATHDLSWFVRYWDQSSRTFAGPQAVNPRVGYGGNEPPGAIGTMLNETFNARGHSYNLELYYRGQNVSDGHGQTPAVYRGRPGEGAVVASQMVTLYDNQTLTGPRSTNAELWEYSPNASNNRNGYYPIPNAVEGPVYNVVEVRLTVW